MRLLELFSGTKSVGKVAETLGYEVTSLDLKNADINTDILNWDYKTYDPKHFDVI
jgi:site-specific DNA-cytosine methylase